MWVSMPWKLAMRLLGILFGQMIAFVCVWVQEHFFQEADNERWFTALSHKLSVFSINSFVLTLQENL